MKVYKPVAALVAAMLLISGCNAANDIPEYTSASTETIEVLKDNAPEYITTTVYQFDEPIALDEKEGKLLLEQTALSWAERKVGEWLTASDMDCDYKIIITPYQLILIVYYKQRYSIILRKIQYVS